MLKTFQTYYKLTKPGIIYGNVYTTIGGFFLAAKTTPNFFLLIQTLLGISFVIAAACVYNNVIDADVDAKMARTKKRAIVTGEISKKNALIYGTILGIIGFSLLLFYSNILTTGLGLIAFVDYVVLYGITKRTSVFGTIVGSISGAMPPVAGYTAVTNQFDTGALLLFLILVFWQMPHFYAIAIFRLKDYTAANIPVLPAVSGIKVTKVHMFLYIIGFLICTQLLTLFHYTKYTYTIVMFVLGLYWLFISSKGFSLVDDTKWAKKVFGISLLLILVFSVLLTFNVVLP